MLGLEAVDFFPFLYAFLFNFLVKHVCYFCIRKILTTMYKKLLFFIYRFPIHRISLLHIASTQGKNTSGAGKMSWQWPVRTALAEDLS